MCYAHTDNKVRRGTSLQDGGPSAVHGGLGRQVDRMEGLYDPYPKLPKNIRQIGERDDIVRVYV